MAGLIVIVKRVRGYSYEISANTYINPARMCWSLSLGSANEVMSRLLSTPYAHAHECSTDEASTSDVLPSDCQYKRGEPGECIEYKFFSLLNFAGGRPVTR